MKAQRPTQVDSSSMKIQRSWVLTAMIIGPTAGAIILDTDVISRLVGCGKRFREATQVSSQC